jgi:hypothetical protein
MADEIQLPKEVNDLVEKIGSVVAPGDVDVYRSVREIDDKSYKLRTVISSWEGQQREERRLRRGYATWLLVALLLQMFLVDLAFFLIGYKQISVDRWVADAFIIGVFGEVAGMTLIVVKYLFPDTGSQLLKLIEKL